MENPKKSTVYIDEAGDLGWNKGTRWFIITAVIVDVDDEKNIRKSLAQIKARLNVHEVHMRKIKEFERRAYIVKTLSSENFTYINVLIDTSKLKQGLTPIVLYNYSCRYLLERVSWLLRDTNRHADIVLSSRGTSRDGELIQYIQRLISYPDNEVASLVFGNISATSPLCWEMLQLADVCATSMFLCYEERAYGFRLPCFAIALSKHIYKRGAQAIKYGIKFFDDNMKPTKDELSSNKICS